MILRLETPEDYEKVEYLTREAFWNVYRPGCSEHLVLHKLRNAPSFITELNFLAVIGVRIAGSIVYSRMYKEGRMCADVAAFGPISVLPYYQGRGVGSMLITHTLQKAKELGYGAVMITGSPDYYHRFGFVQAQKYGIKLPGMSEAKDAPYFMVRELADGFLETAAGIYDFDPCFHVSEAELAGFDEKFPRRDKREPRETDLYD